MSKAIVRSGDLIHDTAAVLGIGEKVLFRKASEGKGFSNAPECADYRYLRWFKYGEIPPYIEDFCLDVWAQREEHPLPRRLAS